MSNRTIPTVDLSKFVHGNEEERKAFVDKLGKAFHEVGFVGVVNHGIPKELVDGFYDESKTFFSQPVSTKRKYKLTNIQIMYTQRKHQNSTILEKNFIKDSRAQVVIY